MDKHLPGFTNKNMSTLDLAVDAEIIIEDIKELIHFKDKNTLVQNESWQQNMKI